MNEEAKPDGVGPGGRSGSDYDIQSRYFAEIGRYKLLTPDEEIELGRRVAAGDEEAKRTLVTSNLRLVVTIARRYASHGQGLMDLIEEGNLGLIRAAGKFDYQRGFRFSTYASWWIKQSIMRGMANQSRALRIPVHVFQAINRYLRVEDGLQGKTVEDGDMAERLDMSVRKTKLIRSLISGIRSDEPLVSAEALQKLAAEQYYGRTGTPEDVLDMQFENAHLMELIDKYLSPREHEILASRYGLDDRDPCTLAEVGEALGISRERVRQIEKRALQKLNLMLTGKKQDDDGSPRRPH